MANAMQIALSFQGLQGATSGLRQVAQQYQQIAVAQNQVVYQIQQFGRGAGGGGGARRPANPWLQLLRSTRFNLPGVSPLVGRTMNAMGAMGPGGALLGGFMGGFLAGVGALTAAFHGLMSAAQAAAETLNKIGDFAAITGGTGRQSALLQMLGISAGQVGSFQEAISGNPIAAAFASRAGVRDLQGPYGQINQSGLMLGFIQALRNMPADERMRTLRATGQESLAPIFNASSAALDHMMAVAQQMGKIADPQAVTAAKDFELSFEGLKGMFAAVAASFGKTLLPGIIRGFNELTDALAGVGNWFNAHPEFGALLGVFTEAVLHFAAEFVKLIPAALQTVLDYVIGWVKSMILVISNIPGLNTQFGLSPMDAGTVDVMVSAMVMGMQAAWANNTAATVQNTQQMSDLNKTFQQGMAGGGERARAALGAGMKSRFLGEALRTDALKLGAFGTGF